MVNTSACARAGFPPRPAVQARYERFTTCERCGRVYWQGSHWQRMCAMLGAALPERPRDDPSD